MSKHNHALAQETVASRVVGPAAQADQRRHARFVVPGSFARLAHQGPPESAVTATLSPAGMLGLFYRVLPLCCEVVNVSKGGLALETRAKLEVEQRVTVNLYVLDAPAPMRLLGRVRWVKPRRGAPGATVGIRFDPFSARPGHNSPRCLYALRKLEAKYR